MTPRQNHGAAGRCRTRPGRLAGRAIVMLTIAGAVLGVAGTAEAYFNVTGGGSGSTKAGTALNLSGTGSSGAALFPGAPAVDLTLSVDNPNSGPVVVSGVTLSGSITGCTTPGVTFSVAPADLPFTVPAGPGHSVTLHNVLTMGTTSSNDCQGKSLTVPLTLSGKLS